MTRTWRAHSRTWIAGLQKQTREQIVAGKHAESPGWQSAELGPWADSKLAFNPKYLERQTRPDDDWLAGLRRITCQAMGHDSMPTTTTWVTWSGRSTSRWRRATRHSTQ